MLTPEARAQVEAYAREKVERARRGGDLPPATVYALDGIDVGWPIYSTTRTYADDGYPVGGVVVAVLPGYVDTDTGEITPTRYQCLDRYQPDPWQYLTADEIALPVSGVNRAMATAAGHWLIRQIPPKRIVYHPVDVERLHDAWLLAKAAALL